MDLGSEKYELLKEGKGEGGAEPMETDEGAPAGAGPAKATATKKAAAAAKAPAVAAKEKQGTAAAADEDEEEEEAVVVPRSRWVRVKEGGGLCRTACCCLLCN